MIDMRACVESSSGNCQNIRIRVVQRPNATLSACQKRQACRRVRLPRADRWHASMSIPLRNLPLMQNWDCHSCSDCCRIEAVITDTKKDTEKEHRKGVRNRTQKRSQDTE